MSNLCLLEYKHKSCGAGEIIRNGINFVSTGQSVLRISSDIKSTFRVCMIQCAAQKSAAHANLWMFAQFAIF